MVLESSSRDIIDKQECISDQGKATAKSTLLLFDGLVLDRCILFTTVQKKFSQREAKRRSHCSLQISEIINFGQYGF